MSRNILAIDVTLTKRVKEILDQDSEALKSHEQIAAHLRETHPREYARRKVTVFRGIVKKIIEDLTAEPKASESVENPPVPGEVVTEGTDVSKEMDVVESTENGQPPTPPIVTSGKPPKNSTDESDSDIACIEAESTPAPPAGPVVPTLFPPSGTEMDFQQAEPPIPGLEAAINGQIHANMQETAILQQSHGNKDWRKNNAYHPNPRKATSKWDQAGSHSKWDQPPPSASAPQQTYSPRPPTLTRVKKVMSKRPRRQHSESSSSSDSDSEEKSFTVHPQTSSISLINDVVLPGQTKTHLIGILKTLARPDLFVHLNVQPVTGLLLHGPSGCGKTLVAKAIANQLNTQYLYISATELVTGVSGDSEKRVRKIFQIAHDYTGKTKRPILIIIDEFEIVGAISKTQSHHSQRIISQLCSSLDTNTAALVIACTSKPENLDTSLRRAGRFDHEFILPIPNETSRLEILEKTTADVKLAHDVDLKIVARLSPGYVGSDLKLLISEAATFAVNDFLNDECEKKSKGDEKAKMDDVEGYDPAACLIQSPVDPFENFAITNGHLEKALGSVTPASKREGFACVPDVTWENIGALDDIREELRLAIVAQVRYPSIFKHFSGGSNKPPGILLAGPPGNGKTLLAKAVANESGLNFIAVNGPELVNMYVGESERAVRAVFTRARHSSPCVIFFDEIDALCPKRQNNSGEQHSARLVNQMLTEMDGISSSSSSSQDSTIFIMAATNRPDMLDPALLRPGRLDKTLYVGLPTKDGRLSILRALTRKNDNLSESLDLEKLSTDSRLSNLSGADIAAVVREASMQAMRLELQSCLASDTPQHIFDTTMPDLQKLDITHFEKALDKVKPSISAKDKKIYAEMEARLKNK